MEHAGGGAAWAGPASTLIAEKYIIGDLKREHLYKKMVTSSFMPEYQRQWLIDLKRKGLNKQIISDSVKMYEVQNSLNPKRKRQKNIQQ